MACESQLLHPLKEPWGPRPSQRAVLYGQSCTSGQGAQVISVHYSPV